MIKNLGKFKQFGGAKVTLQTEDFQRLEKETEHRREGYDNVVGSVEILLSYILKRKPTPEDGRTKMMPLELFGSCLYHYGTVFPEDSPLGVSLLNLGQTESRISALQEMLANEIKRNYMTLLQTGIQEYKDYDTLRKKLESRRLDYDSKLNRLHKAKKEKPELEQEMQAARIKYEDTEHDLIQKMAYLQEFEYEHRDALLQVIDAQLAYHTQSKELLLGLKSNWSEANDTEPNDILDRVVARNENDNTYYSHNNVSSQNTVNASNASIAQSFSDSSTKSLDHVSSGSNITEAATNTVVAPVAAVAVAAAAPAPVPAPITAANEYDHFRKALFDFTGQQDDEISFKVGDVITVINEIDKGWWVGEVHSKRGIFPVNYTEAYDPQKHPLPPLPDNGLLEPSRIAPLPTPNPEQSSIRLTDDLQQTSSTPNQQQALLLPESTPPTSRRPPPPPIVASSPSVPTVTRTRSVAIRAPPPPPITYTCSDCTCRDYIENTTKPGHCITCFHKHTA